MDARDQEVLDRFPETHIHHDNKSFYRGLLDRTLLMGRCRDCEHWSPPGHPICPRCWSEELVPTAVRGSGKVALFTLLHQGQPAAASVPYPVVTVELEEQPGLRFTSTLIDCPHEAIRIDMRVELAWIEHQGNPAPAFRPAREPGQSDAATRS